MGIRHIKYKLLAIFLPCFLVFFILLAGAGLVFSRNALSGSTDDTAKAMGAEYASRVESYIEVALTQQADFADELVKLDAIGNSHLAETLEWCRSRSKVLESAVFIFPDGNALRSDGTEVDLADRAYFQQAMATGEPVVSELVTSRTTGKTAFNVAVPVKDGDRLLGVLTGSFALEKLDALISDLEFLESGYGVIIDESGLVLSHPHMPETVGKLNLTEDTLNEELAAGGKILDPDLSALFAESLQTKSQIRGNYRNLNGEVYKGTFTPITLAGGRTWVFLVTVPAALAESALAELSIILLWILLACSLLATLVIFGVSRMFSKPFTLFKEECMKMAEGDLTDSGKTINSRDELGQASQALQIMRNKLKELMGTVVLETQQVASSSQELTAISEEAASAANQIADSINTMARGTKTQMESLKDLTERAGQIMRGLDRITQSSQEADLLSDTTAEASLKGLGVVKNAMEQMVEVGRSADNVQALILLLKTDFEEIFRIVDLITAIAAQTNLLSLNAAIEAARAGENGTGFAVVADEVRKLAQEAKLAAQQIRQLIEKSRDSMDKTVKASEEETLGVKSGIGHVSASEEFFKGIAGSVEKLSGEIRRITDSIESMTQEGHELVSFINTVENLGREGELEAQTVSSAAEQQLASYEEIASASQGLASLADELQSAVSRFKV